MKRIDLTNRAFGRLTVLRYSHSVRTKSGGGYVMWSCGCSCGNSTTVRTSHLTEGRIQSCGCIFTEGKFDNPRGSKPPGTAYLRYVFGYYLKNSKIRDFEFDLTFEQFMQIVTQPCYYCGSPPAQGKNKSRLGRPNVFNGIVKHNGIDRIENVTGYITSNTVPCCKTCNYAKRQMTQAEFRDWIRRVHAHWAI